MTTQKPSDKKLAYLLMMKQNAGASKFKLDLTATIKEKRDRERKAKEAELNLPYGSSPALSVVASLVNR